jgi:AcrR family transcriptional regulator
MDKERSMGTPRGDSAVTRKAILAAARDLFAQRGVDGVTVREIAAAAGVNHALVHRYFGTKTDMVAEILLNEARILGELARPEADTEASLAAFREALAYLLTEGRTSLLLMTRAELDGLVPERLLEGSSLRPLALLARWFDDRGGDTPGTDARVLAMVLGAAVMGLATVAPMLSAGVGLDGEDPETVLHGCIDALVDVAAVALVPGQDPPAS